jgi:dihydropteroate synthase-like protein
MEKNSDCRVLLVTGRLAENALRRVVDSLGPTLGIEPTIAVLPISVAALMTTEWVLSHLRPPPGIERIVLPGFCSGSTQPIADAFGIDVELGPKDLLDLPEYWGQQSAPTTDYGGFDIEILAEINSAPTLTRRELVGIARRFRTHGADVIDLGCNPGSTWQEVGDAVRAVLDEGLRVSIDSFNPVEIATAARSGAELVLSVNASNRAAAGDWGIEVVAIPDEPMQLKGLDATVEHLVHRKVPFRIDPILEPIGFGFAASLGRCFDARRQYPDAPMLVGVGNVTELTEVDSAGINVLLCGICQELGIHSVLTTEVIPWCRSCVRELDVARRLVAHAVRERVLPKKLDSRLVMLRDPKVHELCEAGLSELRARISDPNYRIFAERGELHVFNGSTYLRGTDASDLFAQIAREDTKLTPSHAFYLGYELAKAVVALTLGKAYAQDQELRWGLLSQEMKPVGSIKH